MFIGKRRRKRLEYIDDNRHAMVHLIFEEVQYHNYTHLETNLDDEFLPPRLEVDLVTFTKSQYKLAKLADAEQVICHISRNILQQNKSQHIRREKMFCFASKRYLYMP